MPGFAGGNTCYRAALHLFVATARSTPPVSQVQVMEIYSMKHRRVQRYASGPMSRVSETKTKRRMLNSCYYLIKFWLSRKLFYFR
jgi:hypothetical protein